MRKQHPHFLNFAAIGLVAQALCLPSFAQDATILARPDYQNWLYDPGADIAAVPNFRQGPAVSLISGGLWASGKAGTPSDGQIELLQALIGQPIAPGAFWYLAPAPLPEQSRFRDERLTVYSAVDSSGVYRNHYTVSAAEANREYAVYLRSTNQSGLSLRLTDGGSGAVIKEGQSLLGTGSDALLTFSWPTSSEDTIRVVGAAPQQSARYEIALYPVLRPGLVLSGALTPSDRVQTNRVAAVGAGRWSYDDYLVQGVRPGERITFRVESAEFVPFIEVRLVADEAEQGYHEFRGGGDFSFSVGGTPEIGPRVYLIRVTSATSATQGSYRISASRIPQITSFSPAAGQPGTMVTVRGFNFLESENSLVTGVYFGGVATGLFVPRTVAGGEEFDAFVPAGAVTGPITVTNDVLGVSSVSSNVFVVYSPIGAVRRESNGRISFAVSNAVPEMRHVVEATADLRPPIQWTSVANYTATASGTWRYTNSTSVGFPERFFRVRRE